MAERPLYALPTSTDVTPDITVEAAEIDVTVDPIVMPDELAATITNFPMLQNVGGTVTIANPTPATDVSDLATEATVGNRYSGGKTAVCATVTASGDTTIHDPAAGKAVRLFWVTAINDPDEAATPLIKIGFGPATTITTELYRVFAVGHWEVFEGAADERLIVNLSAAASVAVTAHIQEITP